MVQNINRDQWEADYVDRKLETRMRENTRMVVDNSAKYNSTFRMGAYTLAIERIAEAVKLRGDF